MERKGDVWFRIHRLNKKRKKKGGGEKREREGYRGGGKCLFLFSSFSRWNLSGGGNIFTWRGNARYIL